MPETEFLQYGGLAVPEGVMMRSPTHFAVAVLQPDGEVLVQSEEIEKTWIGRQKWLKLPFVRGSLALLDAMFLGSKAMRFATNALMKYESEHPSSEKTAKVEVAVPTGVGVEVPLGSLPSNKSNAGRIQDAATVGSMIFGLAMGIFLFVYLPNLIAQMGSHGGNVASWKTNLLSEVIKIAAFLGYIILISRMEMMRRVFQFHGAEHKAINTHEAGLDLTLENCKKQTRLHPRCGTSFAIIVLLISLVVLTFVPRYLDPSQKGNLLVATTIRFVVELVLLPVIAGIAYEAIRLAGKMKNKKLVMALFWPGMMSQYLTTREPDDQQVEVALTSLKAVIPDKKPLTEAATVSA